MDRREMWLWGPLITITLLLTIGLASSLLSNSHFHLYDPN
jgi:hypothetical protein